MDGLSPNLQSAIDALLSRARSPEAVALMERVGPAMVDRPTYRDLAVAIRVAAQHVETNVPEALRGGLRIIDVGPGIGGFMAVASALGNDVSGEETVASSPSVQAYADVVSFWNLRVRYHGFDRYLHDGRAPYDDGSVDIIHLRGSVSAVLSSSKLGIDEAVRRLLAVCFPALRPGGILWMGHNVGALMAEILIALERHRGPFVATPGLNEAVTRFVKP